MRRSVSFAAILAIAAAVDAHDFWIEPSTFHPPAGVVVGIGLRVGEGFDGRPVPRASDSIERFAIIENGREEEISGADGSDPAGWVRVEGRGPAVIVYRSKPSYVELPPARFEAYLRENGLEKIIALRERRGERASAGKEIFSRCAKAILSGSEPSAAVTRPTGLRYEIVSDTDPSRGTSPFRGRVLYDGKPLAGALVVATFKADPRVRLPMRSDSQGRFSFTSPRRGVWLLTSVQMVRAPMLSRADWESLWASLTFETR